MADVLVVDDSNSIRRLLSNTLTRAGYRVIGAGDGTVALEEAQQNDFNLVITDINMPEMNGFTLLEKLRALPRYAHRPVLILTTEYSAEMKAKGRAAGATGWIVKPVDTEKLVSIVHRLLGR